MNLIEIYISLNTPVINYMEGGEYREEKYIYARVST